MPEKRLARTVRRREYVAAGSALSAAILAGCLGDDDDDPADDADDTDDGDDLPADDDADDADDADDLTADDDADDTDDDPNGIERYDVEPILNRGPPLPADASYSQGAALSVDWTSESHYTVMDRSNYDLRHASNLLAEWSYEPGILEFSFRDDIYWWSGDLVDAEDFVQNQVLFDYTYGGDDFNSEPNVIAREAIDDTTVRLSLADTWHEEWALDQTLTGASIYHNTPFANEWIEQYDDTGGDLDAVDEIRNEYEEVRANTDEELVHQFYIPFEFRIEDDLGEVGDDYWVLELVPEKNGQQRAYVEDINFTRWRITATEESELRNVEDFMNEDAIKGHYDHFDPDVEFEFDTAVQEYRQPSAEWGFNFNTVLHPTDNPHFRRGFVYAIDRETYEREPRRELQDLHDHPFLYEARLTRVVSDEVYEQMTNFGTTPEWDRAEEELELGGFERNTDGDWLDQETGEPMELVIDCHSWMDYVGDEGSDWLADLADFGLPTEVLLEKVDEWTIGGSYIGGTAPEMVFDSIFAEGSPWWARNNQFPESVEAPAVGEPDAPEDEWIEYDTRSMTDRLGITTEEGAYQELVDQLAWVSNQLVPRVGAVGTVQVFYLNDNRWYVVPLEDAPDRWTRRPRRKLHFSGLAQYVPEDER